MSARKLTINQQEALDRLADADNAFRNARASAEADAKRLIRERVEKLELRRAILAYEAADAGVSIRRIHLEGLHTTARATATQEIAVGRHLSGVADGTTTPATLTREFWRESGATSLHISPPTDLLAPIIEKLGADPSLTSAEFRVEGGKLEAVTPGYDSATGRHPVVALVLGDAAYQARAVAWFENEKVV